MDREVNSVLAKPYKALMDMGENLIASGNKYVITTKCKYPGALDSLSILLYNFDDNIFNALQKISTDNDLLRLARNFEGESEFLVRCTGLSGEFRILRYRLERDNIIRQIEEKGVEKGEESVRDSIISKILTEPAVSAAVYTSSDAMSIRSIFKGIGAELILIDSK